MPYRRVGDVELYYELHDFTEPWKAGPAPVVLIHGLGSEHHVWHYQVPEISRRFPTITLDLRGHGLSSKSEAACSMADMGLDVVRLLRVLGVERVHLVGLSMGGLVAQQIAVDFPTVLCSLTLCDTFCVIPPEMQNQAREALRFITDRSMAEVAAARLTNAFTDRVNPVMRAYWIDRAAQNHKPSYEAAAQATFAFDVAERLPNLRLPALIVAGSEDRVTPALLTDELARRIPAARMVKIDNAGHLPNLENPTAFNRALLEFLPHAAHA